MAEPMMQDPDTLAHDDLVEAMRCIQETLWPKGNPDHEWGASTLSAVAGIVGDAGLGPKR